MSKHEKIEISELSNQKNNIQYIPFTKGSVAYRVMLGSIQGGEHGGWADLTMKEIAEVLGVSYYSVLDAVRKIEIRTGYKVPHKSGQKARWGVDDDFE